MHTLKKYVLFSLFAFSAVSFSFPAHSMQVNQITIGTGFHPKFRWGGNMDDITKGLVVGIAGFVCDAFIDCSIKLSDNQPIIFTNPEVAFALSKVGATIGLGSGGGLLTGLAETAYKMRSHPLSAVGKLAAYTMVVLFIQGKLAQ